MRPYCTRLISKCVSSSSAIARRRQQHSAVIAAIRMQGIAGVELCALAGRMLCGVSAQRWAKRSSTRQAQLLGAVAPVRASKNAAHGEPGRGSPGLLASVFRPLAGIGTLLSGTRRPHAVDDQKKHKNSTKSGSLRETSVRARQTTRGDGT